MTSEERAGAACGSVWLIIGDTDAERVKGEIQ